LKAATKEAASLLESKVDAGELVLREDFFKDKFSELHEFAGAAGAPKKKFTLRDTNPFLITLTEVAKSMLKVAEPDRANSAAYLAAWVEEEKALMAKMGPPPGIGVAPDLIKVWEVFFETWRGDVARLQPDQFRNALRQAAYSILRLGLDIEADWIKRVREQGNIATSTAAGSASDSGGTYVDHGHHRHYRIMRRIERHHYRRTP